MEIKRSLFFSLLVVASVALVSGASLRAPSVKPSVQAKPAAVQPQPTNPAGGLSSAPPVSAALPSAISLPAAPPTPSASERQAQNDKRTGSDGSETVSLPGPKIFKPKIWKKGKHHHVKKHLPGPKYFKPKVLKADSDASERASHSDTTFVADVDSDDEDSSDLGDDDDGEPIALESNNNSKSQDKPAAQATSQDVDHNSSVFASSGVDTDKATEEVSANAAAGAGAVVGQVGDALSQDNDEDADDGGDDQDDEEDGSGTAATPDEGNNALATAKGDAKADLESNSVPSQQQQGSVPRKNDAASSRMNAAKAQTNTSINAGEKQGGSSQPTAATPRPVPPAPGQIKVVPAAVAGVESQKTSAPATAENSAVVPRAKPGPVKAAAGNAQVQAPLVAPTPEATKLPATTERSTSAATVAPTLPQTKASAGPLGAVAATASAGTALAGAGVGITDGTSEPLPSKLQSALASLVPGAQNEDKSSHTALGEGAKQPSSSRSLPTVGGAVEKKATVQRGPFVASVAQAIVPDTLKGKSDVGTMATAPGAKDLLPQPMPAAHSASGQESAGPKTADGADEKHEEQTGGNQMAAMGGKVFSSAVAAVPAALNAALTSSGASAPGSITASRSPQDPASGPEVSKTPTAPDGSTIPEESPYHLSKQAVLTIDNHLPEVVDKTEDLVPDPKEDGEDEARVDIVGGLTEGVPKKPTRHEQALMDSCKLKCEAQAIKDDEAEVARLENNEKQIVKVENMKGGPESGGDDEDDVTVGKDVVSTNLLQLGATVETRVRARMEACMKFVCPWDSHTTADGHITENGKLDTKLQVPEVVKDASTAQKGQAPVQSVTAAPASGNPAPESAKPEDKGPENPVPVTLAEAIGETEDQEFHGGSVTLAEAMQENHDKDT